MYHTLPSRCSLSLLFTQVLLQLSNFFFFFFNDPAPPEIYTLPLHDALPISPRALHAQARAPADARAAPPRARRRGGRARHRLRRPPPRAPGRAHRGGDPHRLPRARGGPRHRPPRSAARLPAERRRRAAVRGPRAARAVGGSAGDAGRVPPARPGGPPPLRRQSAPAARAPGVLLHERARALGARPRPDPAYARLPHHRDRLRAGPRP